MNLDAFEISARLLYDDDGRAVPWEQAGAYERYMYLQVAQGAHRYIVRPKRLSGPELAAEYWRSSRDWISLEIDGWVGCEVTDDVILETLLRFASLPHYDEEPA